MTAFWRQIVDETDAFPRKILQVFLQSGLTGLGETCGADSVGKAWEKLTAARGMRNMRPRLNEIDQGAVWPRCTQRSGLCGTEVTHATRDGQPTRCRRPLCLTYFFLNTIGRAALFAKITHPSRSVSSQCRTPTSDRTWY